jgi:hypothetical protein
MKTKKSRQRLHAPGTSQEHNVHQEIDNFLRALSSYPDRFAREPDLSFQQHLSSIVAADHPQSSSHDHNGSRHRSG